MNNGTTDAAPAASHNRPIHSRHAEEDELSKAKRDLLHAEVRLARARATAAAAEIDIKVASARLKSLAK